MILGQKNMKGGAGVDLCFRVDRRWAATTVGRVQQLKYCALSEIWIGWTHRPMAWC